MAKRRPNSYWDDAAKREHEWQVEQLKSDARFDKIIGRPYQVAVDNINKEIKANIDKIGGAQNLVKAEDMAEYERLAQQAVQHANELRAAGHHVTRADFDDAINQRLKIYNATMRVNQLELEKSKLGVHLINLGMDTQATMADRLYNSYIKEAKRQAGILAGTTENSRVWASQRVMQAINARTGTANFSQRIWSHIDVMKANLDGALATASISGDNPRDMIKYLKKYVQDDVGDQAYAAERLARTETARVQYEAQKSSLKENDYKYCKWYYEPGACPTCTDIGDSSGEASLPDGVYAVDDVPDVPVHPNCRCDIGAYWVDGRNNSYGDDDTSDTDLADLLGTGAGVLSEISTAEDFRDAVKPLGIDNVQNMSGLDSQTYNQIYQTINSEFKKHSELRGFLTTVKGYTRRSSKVVAAASFGGQVVSGRTLPDAQLRFRSALRINKAAVKSAAQREATIKREVNNGWWSQKKDYTGVIRHELAHTINSRAGLAEVTDNASIDKIYSFPEYKAIGSIVNRNDFAKDLITETFHKIRVKPTQENVKKYISEYASKTRNKNAICNYWEAFAEAYSDESGGKFSTTFQKLLAKKLRGLYK